MHICALLRNEVTYPRFSKGDTEAWGMTWLKLLRSERCQDLMR